MAGSSTAELRLRPTREDDLEYVVAAEADPDNAPFLAPSPRAEHLGFLRDPLQRHLIAEVDGRAAGFALLRLHPDDRAVELRRLAVTEKGRGHGRATLRLAIAEAFEEHGAHRLWLDVKPHNERALALYRSAGFAEEGLLRDALYQGGSFESLIVMSILARMDSMTPQQAAFYYDLASPDSYLAAERVVGVLGAVPEFVPVRIGSVGGFRCAEEDAIHHSDVERRAAAYGLMPVRWPDPFPADTEWAMLVATYAKQTGRVVAYSLAAFRQAFAAGRDLGERDWVLVAAAAAEMHPAAVLKSAELRSTRRRLEETTDAARAAGVADTPAVRVGTQVFHGDRELEAAARALGARV